MSRVSRGCLPCRTRRVKCDEGRPSCRRCIQRNEICTGYRDELSLIFRNENEKAARSSLRRRASSGTLEHSSGGSSKASSTSHPSPGSFKTASTSISSSSGFGNFIVDARFPESLNSSAEDPAVAQFFEQYVMYPCNDSSTPGFLEQLPCLFEEVNVEGRSALRWAVRAAAYASLSGTQNNPALHEHALKCYGLALSALGESLATPGVPPDDYDLMSVVVLDIFESLYLDDSAAKGAHAEGMSQILRLRGPGQIYSPRGWSLFRLSHHRLQMQQLAYKKEPLSESNTWLDLLNEDLPYVRIEKDNLEISKISERARALRRQLLDTDVAAEQLISIVKEMQDLDQVATTWRKTPEWMYRTIHRSDVTTDESKAARMPEFIQLHRDVWVAFQWNYHRTARILLHEQILNCLDRLEEYNSKNQHIAPPEEIDMYRLVSVSTIRTCIEEVFSTVPQSLADIDYEGNLIGDPSQIPKCRGVGGYFLLWPVKIIKTLRFATEEQRNAGRAVFERIRECTGMKATLGDLSSI